MKFKSLKVLLLIFILLAFGAGIYIVVQNRPSSKTPFANKELTKIEVEGRDTTCVFEKRAEGGATSGGATSGGATSGWKIVKPAEYAVDTVAFNGLLEALKSLEIGEAVSSRKEKQENLEVGENGIRIKVFWDNKSKELIIGKMAGDFMHWYIRFPPKNEIYLSTGVSKYMVYRNTDDWRDHTILVFDTNKVAEMDLGEQKIVRTDAGWTNADTIIEASKVNPILSMLGNFRADGFGKEEFEPEFEVKIVFTDNTEKHIFIGDKGEGDKYPAKVEGNATIFLLYQWKVDKLKKI
ncbi:MAG: DUF4340 domain-containing protein [Candidatus Stahlbacteria bacterium]|nr:DUF4340 domain-containing protein [Candidatus Stahlbacteria bacterium]